MRLRQDVGDLLDRLIRAGFRIDISARVRVRRVLARLPHDADRDTLRDALHACLVSSQIESQLFSETFDRWLDEGQASRIGRRTKAPPQRPPDDTIVPDTGPRSRRDAIKRFLLAPKTAVAVPGLIGLAAILIALILGLGEWIAILSRWIADRFRPGPPSVGPDLPLPSSLPLIVLLLGVGGIVRAVIVGVQWLALPPRPLKKPFRPPSQPDAPAFQAGLLGGTPRRLSQEDVESIVELLAYVPTDLDEEALDIPASIERTVRAGGLVQLEHPLRGRIPAIVVVEDDWSAGRYWNPIAGDLAEGLETRGVVAEHVLFFGTFADLGAHGAAGREGAGTVFADLLERLQALSPAVVFIVTDGAHLRGDDVALLRALREVAPTLWLDHREADVWDEALAIPQAAGLPVAEASASGIRALLGGLVASEPARQRMPRRAVPAYADPMRRVIARLGPARSWAEDCALVRPISPGLAEALRERFHRQVSPLGFGRMASLEGSVVGSAGLVFTPAVEDMLARGFRCREPANRRRVADFIGSIIVREASAVPETEALFQAGAAWTRLRAEFLAEADAATRAAIVTLTRRFPPLRGTVQAEMRRLTRDTQGSPILSVAELGSVQDIMSLTGRMPAGLMRERDFYALSPRGKAATLPGSADRTVGTTIPGVGILVATISEDQPALTLLSDEGQVLQTFALRQTGFRGARPVAVAAGAGMVLLLLAADDRPSTVVVTAYRLPEGERRLDDEGGTALDASLTFDPRAERPFSIAFDAQDSTAMIGSVGGRTHLVVISAGRSGPFRTAYFETEADLIEIVPTGGGFVAALAPDRLQIWESPPFDKAEAPQRRDLLARPGTVARLVAGEAAERQETMTILAYAVPEAGGLVAVRADGTLAPVLPAAGALSPPWVSRAQSVQLTQRGDAVAVFLSDGGFGAIDLATGLDALDAEKIAVGRASARGRLLDASAADRLAVTVRSGGEGLLVDVFEVLWQPQKAPADGEPGASNQAAGGR